MTSVIVKTTGIWFLIVFAAILNGMFREKVLTTLVGDNIALPISGLSLAVLVFVISLLFIPLVGKKDPKVFIFIGIYWVVLTLIFEFGFGYFVVGKSWQDILQVFNITKGDFFVFVLGVTAISPYLAAKIRGVC